MKLHPLFGLLALASAAWAEPRTSADYTLAPESTGAGGGRATSANYTADSAVSDAGGLAAAGSSPVQLAKTGYIGQLYEATTLAPTADPPTIDEGGSRQLAVSATCDAGTTLGLAATDVAWSVFSGPLGEVSATGLASAGIVYQDTPATVRATWGGLIGDLGLTVLDTDPDNFGSYAGDGLEDSWQVFYFGVGNLDAGPAMDPDGDGQDNEFEHTAGLVPTDPLSRLLLRIALVAGQPTHRNLVFQPVVAGRSYRILASTNLEAGTWVPLPGSPPVSDNGDERTVTDTAATEARKFYQVEVTKP